ncbi:MAG: glutamate racemase [bacterium]
MKQNCDRPIGIFDSGLGGLTVFKAVRKLLPRENLIYFGDTAHVPYGTKSPEAVRLFSLAIARHLASMKIKLLVIACNTASSLVMDAVRRAVKVPVIGVIEPGAGIAAAATRNRRIGVIGTQATVSSRAYFRALSGRGRFRVFEKACPLFVPLAEEGWLSGKVPLLAAERYLEGFKKTGADTLILGCTHYPLLKEVIRKVLGGKMVLVDSAEAVAGAVLDELFFRSLLRPRGKGTDRFIASDAPEKFRELALRLLRIRTGRVGVKRLEK